MRQLTAFLKKEWMEVWRTGKFFILSIIFTLFGIMNPAIAKLTPFLMEQFSESLEETGIIITEVTVNAMTSWTQFYKNIPMAMIIFLLMFSGILTTELQKGTLINMITKGLTRKFVIIAKTTIMMLLWTINYWLCFGITYVYNAYFWDDEIKYLYFSVFCIYLLGIWLILLLMLMSTIFSSASFVTVGTGGLFFIMYLFSILPDIKQYLPIKLLDASGLLSQVGTVGDFELSIGVTIGLCVIQVIGAMVIFDRRKI